MRNSIDPDVSVLEYGFASVGIWRPTVREDVMVSSSKVEGLFLDIPTLEDEMKPLSRDLW
jgi:hypothetical protein